MDNQISAPAPQSGGANAKSNMNPRSDTPARRKLITMIVVFALLIAGLIGIHEHNIANESAAAATRPKAPAVGAPGGPIPVQTATVSTGNLARTISLVGNINALQDVEVSSRISSRVLDPGPLEGTHVTAGQPLIELDAADLEANVRQDEASIANAEQQKAEAIQNYDIQLTQAKQNVVNARAAANADQENYLLLARGNRKQQILEAKSQLLGAQATEHNALITLNEDKTLYAQGAIAKSVLDTAQTTYDVDKQQTELQQQAYSLELAGYQTEQIRAAKETVREAVATLKNEIANERQVAVDKAVILADQATVQQDEAKKFYDEQQVSYATINSPINGIVAARDDAVGETATPGADLMRIVNVRTVYFEPTVSESDFDQIHVNDPVVVHVDALPGMTFSGRVDAMFPAADTTSRLFSLRVMIDDPGYVMRPGMFARGIMTTYYAKNVPIIPNSALVPANTSNGYQVNTSSNGLVSHGTALPPMDVVVVGPNNTALLKPVTVSVATMQAVAITSGLNPGDQLVVTGEQGLKNGQKLSIQSTNQTTSQMANVSNTPS